MRNLILLFITAFLTLSCNVETNELQTADAKANVCQKQIVLSPTVTGTIEEELASMTVQCASKKVDILTWTVDPETTYHVVIQNEAGQWLLQTHVNGSLGFYISGYIVNRDPNDGNINIVKGKQYYLYFTKYDIKVPFVID